MFSFGPLRPPSRQLPLYKLSHPGVSIKSNACRGYGQSIAISCFNCHASTASAGGGLGSYADRIKASCSSKRLGETGNAVPISWAKSETLYSSNIHLN